MGSAPPMTVIRVHARTRQQPGRRLPFPGRDVEVRAAIAAFVHELT